MKKNSARPEFLRDTCHDVTPRFENMYFIIDNFHSHAMGVQGCYIVNTGSNNTPMTWMGAQNIVSNRLIGWDNPITVRSQKENLTFTLVFTIPDESFLSTVTYNFGKIFGKSVPVPLEISDDRLKMIYVMPTNQRELYRYMDLKGHFAIDFEATTPYWLTPVERINNRVLSAGDAFVIENKSNVQNSDGSYDVFPYLKFQVIDTVGIITEQSHIISEVTEFVTTEVTDQRMITENSPQPMFTPNTPPFPAFELIHVSDKRNPNRAISFSGLQVGEIIEMDNRLKQIQSSTGLNRFPNWNRQVFKLHEGYNRFVTRYNCILWTAIQYPNYR